MEGIAGIRLTSKLKPLRWIMYHDVAFETAFAVTALKAGKALKPAILEPMMGRAEITVPEEY